MGKDGDKLYDFHMLGYLQVGWASEELLGVG